MRFARNLHLNIDSAIDLKSLRSQISPYLMTNRVRDPKLGPAAVTMPGSNEGMRGLMLTAAVTTSGGACLMQFPEELRIYPDDACLHSLNQILTARQSNTVQVQYQ
jgi:DNA polymerase-3 subunit alpha